MATEKKPAQSARKRVSRPAPGVSVSAQVQMHGQTIGTVTEFDSGRIGFNYDPEYLGTGGRSISPEYLPTEAGSFEFPELRRTESFLGLPGVLAEALRLAASRHEQLDLDPTEFGAGHRILPIDAEGNVSLDVYLYDTLSGGAGYAELAAKYFEKIAAQTLALLEGCSCDTSCTECLDHFHNQHLKRLLDRKLAASLLRYGMDGVLPQSKSSEAQGVLLHALASSLRLDGIRCDFAETNGQQIVPLTARQGSKKLLINVFPSLLAESDVALECQAGESIYQLTELALRSDLPAVHSEIRRRLAA